MECIVEYDYVAAQDDELTIHRGDIIKNVCSFEDGWKRGCLNGKEGVFPDNFVRIIKQSNPKPGNPENEVIAKFKEQLISNGEKEEGSFETFQMHHENESGKFNHASTNNRNNCLLSSNYKISHENMSILKHPMNNDAESLNYNNESSLINSKNQNELRVQQRQQPQIPQQSHQKPTQQNPPSNQVIQTVVVMFDYKAENMDELNLEVGELISVLDKNLVDDGWWKGAKKNGEIGMFPSNFVEPVIDNFVCASIMKKSVKDDINLYNNSQSNQIREQSNFMNSVSTTDLSLDKRSQPMNPSYRSTSLFKAPNLCIKTKSVNATSDSKFDVQKQFKQLNDSSKHLLSYPESSKGDDLSNSYEKSRMKGSRNGSPMLQQDYQALKGEFDKFRNDVDYKFSKLSIRIQTLIEEIDEEKKQRAASEIELIRLRRVVHMLDAQNINGPSL